MSSLVTGTVVALIAALLTYYFMVWRAKRKRREIQWLSSAPTQIMEVAAQVAGSIKYREHTVRRLMRYVFEIKNVGHEHIAGPGKRPLTWSPPQPVESEESRAVVLVANVLSWRPSTAPQPTLVHEELGSDLTILWETLNPRDCLEVEVICDCEQDGSGDMVGLFDGTFIISKQKSYSETADDEHRRGIRKRIWTAIAVGFIVGGWLSYLQKNTPLSEYAILMAYGMTALITFLVYHSARLGTRRKTPANPEGKSGA